MILSDGDIPRMMPKLTLPEDRVDGWSVFQTVLIDLQRFINPKSSESASNGETGLVNGHPQNGRHGFPAVGRQSRRTSGRYSLRWCIRPVAGCTVTGLKRTHQIFTETRLLVKMTPVTTIRVPRKSEIVTASASRKNAIATALMGTKLMNSPAFVGPMALIPS